MWRGHNKGSATGMKMRLGIVFGGEEKGVKIYNWSTHFPGWSGQWISSEEDNEMSVGKKVGGEDIYV